MTEILYLVIGAIAGGMAILLLPYRSLRGARARIYAELVGSQTKNNELQSAMIEQQSTAYQARQALLAQQKRLEGDLHQAHARHAELERQRDDATTQIEQQKQAYLRETTQLRDAITRMEQEQIALQDRFAQESTQWDRERQSLLLHIAQVDDQLRILRQDKAAQDARHEQQNEVWERERLALQIQMNTLEDNLTLQKARAGQTTLSPDSALLVEQLRAEATADLNRQRVVWEEERQALQEQMERLQAERRSLREQVASAGLEIEMKSFRPSSAEEQGAQDWRQLLEHERQERHALAEKLEARDRQSERERAALEAEIEQLMERLLRMHRERQ